jgi:hypothetical protein
MNEIEFAEYVDRCSSFIAQGGLVHVFARADDMTDAEAALATEELSRRHPGWRGGVLAISNFHFT